MSEKKLQASRYIENFIPPNIIENSVHQVCASVADAFLGQIEYGKDYVINTGLMKDDWADGFGTKYTYDLKFDELVRCKDCKHGYESTWPASWNVPADYLDCTGCLVTTWDYYNDEPQSNPVPPDGYCAWGERREV